MDASNLFLIGIGVVVVLALTLRFWYARVQNFEERDAIEVMAAVLIVVTVVFTFLCAILGLANRDTSNERDFEREVQECVAMGGTPDLDGYELDECVGV